MHARAGRPRHRIDVRHPLPACVSTRDVPGRRIRGPVRGSGRISDVLCRGVPEIVETELRAILGSTRRKDAVQRSQAMPLDVVAAEHPVAENDATYAGTMHVAAPDRQFARNHDECCTASTNECWPFRRAALPTIDEIRYASELRRRVRDRYLRRPEPSVLPWCVGVD